MSSKDSGEPIQRDPISRSSGGGDAEPPATPEDEDGTVSPHEGGQSESRHGEDIEASEGKEAGRKNTGTEGKAQRPTGTSDSRDATSVDPDVL